MTSKKLSLILVTGLFLGTGLMGLGCSKKMAPARAIPPGDTNTRLCKETYLQCRSQCASTEDKDTRLSCADLCERDVDTCLLQSRAPSQ